jgi:hypothetical protein
MSTLLKKAGADLIPPGSSAPAFWCVSREKNFSAPRNHPAPGALEYYGNQSLKNRWVDALPVPRRAGIAPITRAVCQTAAGLDLREASPPAPFTACRSPCATVPPDRRASVYRKEVGTAGLAPRSGATSFSSPCSPSDPKAPPGTCGPVEEVWRWRKLVIQSQSHSACPDFQKTRKFLKNG